MGPPPMRNPPGPDAVRGPRMTASVLSGDTTAFDSLRQQRRPRRVRGIARRRHALLVATCEVDGEEGRPGIAAGIAEEHQHTAIGRPGRTLVVIAFGQEAFVRSVGLDHADTESAAALLGEGNVVTARRPDRRRILALAEADALCLPATCPH